MTWVPETFEIAVTEGPENRNGYTYRGLGLHMSVPQSPKGRRPPRWTLTHLNTGHGICHISGKVADAFPLASQIAECSEWDFDGMTGWKNRDPQLLEKVIAIAGAHPKRITFTSGYRGPNSEKVAQQIALGRME